MAGIWGRMRMAMGEAMITVSGGWRCRMRALIVNVPFHLYL